MRNRCHYWPEVSAGSPGEYAALGKLAEGEELGSNLLHVAQSSPEDPGGSGSLKLGRRLRNPRPNRGRTVRDDPTACRAGGWPTHPETPMKYGRGVALTASVSLAPG